MLVEEILAENVSRLLRGPKHKNGFETESFDMKVDLGDAGRVVTPPKNSEDGIRVAG